jgi:hypothetical protein
LDKILDPKLTSIKIYLGLEFCTPSNISTVDLTCIFTDISVGYFKPVIRTNLGDLIIDNSITDILVRMTLDSISPNTVNIFFKF